MGEFDIFWNAEYGEHSGQSKESYAKMLVAFEAGREINHNKVIEQQSQIEQLEKEKAELQGRIRKATSKWIVATSIATTQESGLSDTFYQKLDELHDALVGFEETSRGEHE